MQNIIFNPIHSVLVKGTISVISSDPPCKDENDQFTMVSFKALSAQAWIRYECLWFKKKFIWGFSTKAICAFLLQENILKLLELNIWRNDHIFQIIDQIKNSKVPFKPLHGGLFKISLTVLFNIFHFHV